MTSRRGLTVFFTGLSGAGKSTVARLLSSRFVEVDDRPLTLLDGDAVRRDLSPDLGFSRSDRDLHILRVGSVAAEITKGGGIAISASIAPYAAARLAVRRLIEPVGDFVLIYLSTPLEVCEQRDIKGLYAKARRGMVLQFTGVSDPYEVPVDAEVVIDTSHVTPGEAVSAILLHLKDRYVRL